MRSKWSPWMRSKWPSPWMEKVRAFKQCQGLVLQCHLPSWQRWLATTYPSLCRGIFYKSKQYAAATANLPSYMRITGWNNLRKLTMEMAIAKAIKTDDRTNHGSANVENNWCMKHCQQKLSDRQILGFANLIPMSGHGFTRGMPRTHELQIQIGSCSTCMDTPTFNLRILLNWQYICKVQYQWDQQGIELRIKCSVAQTSSTISLKWLRILPGVGAYAPPDAWSWI